jgi:putative flippase GtrA
LRRPASAGLIGSLSRRRGVRQFLKFGIVGASGMAVNFVAAHALEKTTGFSWFADFSIGFMLGGISNYVLNRIWTFGSRRNPWLEGMQFLAVSAIALLAGNAVIAIARQAGFHHFTATWFLATLSGIFINFFLNKYWTFRHLN